MFGFVPTLIFIDTFGLHCVKNSMFVDQRRYLSVGRNFKREQSNYHPQFSHRHDRSPNNMGLQKSKPLANRSLHQCQNRNQCKNATLQKQEFCMQGSQTVTRLFGHPNSQVVHYPNWVQQFCNFLYEFDFCMFCVVKIIRPLKGTCWPTMSILFQFAHSQTGATSLGRR